MRQRWVGRISKVEVGENVYLRTLTNDRIIFGASELVVGDQAEGCGSAPTGKTALKLR